MGALNGTFYEKNLGCSNRFVLKEEKLLEVPAAEGRYVLCITQVALFTTRCNNKVCYHSHSMANNLRCEVKPFSGAALFDVGNKPTGSSTTATSRQSFCCDTCVQYTAPQAHAACHVVETPQAIIICLTILHRLMPSFTVPIYQSLCRDDTRIRRQKSVVVFSSHISASPR